MRKLINLNRREQLLLLLGLVTTRLTLVFNKQRLVIINNNSYVTSIVEFFKSIHRFINSAKCNCYNLNITQLKQKKTPSISLKCHF